MKIYKKIQMILVVALSCVMCFCGCGKEKQTVDFSGIKSICELATLKCYYHNVAKSTKEKGSGLAHLGEKERKFWSLIMTQSRLQVMTLPL